MQSHIYTHTHIHTYNNTYTHIIFVRKHNFKGVYSSPQQSSANKRHKHTATKCTQHAYLLIYGNTGIQLQAYSNNIAHPAHTNKLKEPKMNCHTFSTTPHFIRAQLALRRQKFVSAANACSRATPPTKNTVFQQSSNNRLFTCRLRADKHTRAQTSPKSHKEQQK